MRKFSICLLLSLTSYEIYIGTFNLGSVTCNLILLFLILSNESKKQDKNSSSTKPNNKAFLLVFLNCSLVNLSAVLLHLSDSFWQNGTALELILKNSFYSNYYKEITEISKNFPIFFQTNAKILIHLQIFFQILMFPLSFIRYGFFLIRIWGLMFSFLTLVFLKLSFLPFFLTLFWILSFYFPLRYQFRISDFLSKNITRQQIFIYAGIIIFLGSSASIYAKSKFRSINNLETNRYSNIIDENIFEKYFLTATSFLGLNAPNVFNSQDILSDRKWVVIYNIQKNEKNLIPFTYYDGSRLTHDFNDIMNYRISIPLRRSLLYNDNVQTYDHIIKACIYDFKKNIGKRSSIYEFDIIEKSEDRITKRIFKNKAKERHRINLNNLLSSE